MYTYILYMYVLVHVTWYIEDTNEKPFVILTVIWYTYILRLWWFNYRKLLLYTKFEFTCLSGLWCFGWGALVALYCICDSSSASWAQLVRAMPRKWTVIGLSLNQGSFFSLKNKLPWASCVVLLCLSIVLCCVALPFFLSISWMIKHASGWHNVC